jgi:hypothetical protein
MASAVAPHSGVCPEYQFLLESCHRALATWQRHRASVERNPFAGLKAIEELKSLQANYARAYSQLEIHEHSCATCQYVSKIGGLDFESMSSALNYYKRSA